MWGVEGSHGVVCVCVCDEVGWDVELEWSVKMLAFRVRCLVFTKVVNILHKFWEHSLS